MTLLGTTLPQITWGSTYQNTIVIQYPADDWNTFSIAREQLDRVQTLGGSEYAYAIGQLPYQHMLRMVIRWIPQEDTIVATGWDGTFGWRAFLEYARRKNTIRFYPDADTTDYFTCYLESPMEGGPQLEPDGTKRIELTLTRYTNPFDTNYFG